MDVVEELHLKRVQEVEKFIPEEIKRIAKVDNLPDLSTIKDDWQLFYRSVHDSFVTCSIDYMGSPEWHQNATPSVKLLQEGRMPMVAPVSVAGNTELLINWLQTGNIPESCPEIQALREFNEQC